MFTIKITAIPWRTEHSSQGKVSCGDESLHSWSYSSERLDGLSSICFSTNTDIYIHIYMCICMYVCNTDINPFP